MRTVRVISGEFGGRKILAPDGKTTHPMSERVRNALFNILGDEVEGVEVLDAFAGTGAVGLEALSRGAKQVTFVESDREAQRTLQENVKTLDAQSRVKLVHSKVELWHKSNPEDKFDLIFCDPPFGDMQLSTVMLLFSHLKPDALMVLSQPGRGESLPAANGVVVVDNRSYGSAALTFYRQDKI
jgi:16S rRNA (guanine966-N2)-methyltransferase